MLTAPQGASLGPNISISNVPGATLPVQKRIVRIQEVENGFSIFFNDRFQSSKTYVARDVVELGAVLFGEVLTD